MGNILINWGNIRENPGFKQPIRIPGQKNVERNRAKSEKNLRCIARRDNGTGIELEMKTMLYYI